MKSFSQFSEGKINESSSFEKINESSPVVFKGLKGDPYQYKIDGDKYYFAKASSGELPADSDLWIEQKSDKGMTAIKNLYSKVSSSVSNLEIDEETKNKIIELQEILNKAKKVMPKLWTLPLETDGIPGWRTAWSWYIIMIVYPQMAGPNPGINDIVWYTKQDFDGFKNPENWKTEEGEPEIKNSLDYFQKYIIDSRWTEDGKISFDLIIKDTKKTVDFMIGELEPGSKVSYLYCTSIIKSIPSSIKAEIAIVEDDCPLKTLPTDLECKHLDVSSANSSSPFKIPLIKTNNISIHGPAKLSEEWSQIDYLYIEDNPYTGTGAIADTIPKNLKKIGNLSISSSGITSIPDDLKVGEIMENYEDDPIVIDPIINSIPVVDEKTLKKKKKPWLKRIFSKEKYEYYYESERYPLYEKFTGDPGDLSISECVNIKTLPKGLSILGNFYIGGSGIEALTDEEIREVCDIKGKIIRFEAPILNEE